MAHQARMSNVGSRREYKGDDQAKYSQDDVSKASAAHGVNVAGHKNKTEIMNQLRGDEICYFEALNERHKNEPGYTATMHGNEPSRGAKVDAEIQNEEAEMLERRKGTDSLPGKKSDHNTAKSEQKQELDAAVKQAQKEHSKSGANTGRQGGMEYVPRKKHTDHP